MSSSLEGKGLYDFWCLCNWSVIVVLRFQKPRELTFGQQEGILYTHASIWAVEGPQRHFLWIVYIQYQHLQAVFWGWMTCIGCYVPQTCSLRCRGISTMKVSLLYLRCRPWEDSLSFRKTVHRRQDGGGMFLSTNISRTFFEQEEKVSMIVFR